MMNNPSIPQNNNNNNNNNDTKFRLVPCSLEIADAVILIPSSSNDVYPSISDSLRLPNYYIPRTGHGQGLLLVGPALQQIRQQRPQQRQLAKGATRIHPYRVVRGENIHHHQTQNSRRSSIISITSFSHAV